jgi:hypothetical protein
MFSTYTNVLKYLTDIRIWPYLSNSRNLQPKCVCVVCCIPTPIKVTPESVCHIYEYVSTRSVAVSSRPRSAATCLSVQRTGYAPFVASDARAKQQQHRQTSRPTNPKEAPLTSQQKMKMIAAVTHCLRLSDMLIQTY